MTQQILDIFLLESDSKLVGTHYLKIDALPVSGTSVGLMILLICSIDWRSGLRPP